MSQSTQKWSSKEVGRQFTATAIAERFSSRKRMVQAVDLNHEEGQRRLARGSTPASEGPASSRHQDSEGTLGQTQTAICNGSRRYTREAGCMSGASAASVACAKENVGATMAAAVAQLSGLAGRSHSASYGGQPLSLEGMPCQLIRWALPLPPWVLRWRSLSSVLACRPLVGTLLHLREGIRASVAGWPKGLVKRLQVGDCLFGFWSPVSAYLSRRNLQANDNRGKQPTVLRSLFLGVCHWRGLRVLTPGCCAGMARRGRGRPAQDKFTKRTQRSQSMPEHRAGSRGPRVRNITTYR